MIEPQVEPLVAESGERAAARQLEAFFLRQFLAEARPKNPMLGGGFAGDTFQDMLNGALADAMTEAGGLGLIDTFESALSGEMSVPSHYRSSPLDAVTLDGGVLHQPVVGQRTSGFGVRRDPVTHAASGHLGLDIAAATGTPVVAAATGRVVHAGPAGTYGNLVTVRHADGTETRYAHLSVVRVERGDAIAAGARLGDVGSTGRSTGPHLHFEVRRHGQAIDPAPLLTADRQNK